MAKKKIGKRNKAKINLRAIAAYMFFVTFVAFIGARIGIGYYNHSLSIDNGNRSIELATLRDELSALENEVNELQSRDRVVALANEDGIETNQDQVIIMGEYVKEQAE